jgi:hypothetical protein
MALIFMRVGASENGLCCLLLYIHITRECMQLFLLWTQHILVVEIAISNTLTDGNMHVNKRSGKPQHAYL